MDTPVGQEGRPSKSLTFGQAVAMIRAARPYGLYAFAQGAALRYLGGRTGVKDLVVWTFQAAIPGRRFPADKRVRRADFGLSSLGRQT